MPLNAPLEPAASTLKPPSGGWPPASPGALPEEPLLLLVAPELELDPEVVLAADVAPELLEDPPPDAFPRSPDPPSFPTLLVQLFVVELPPEHAAKAAVAVRIDETR
jgi:hypothetical protein